MQAEESREIDYIILPSEYYYLLEPVFKEYGKAIPDPNLSRIAVAISDDKIVGIGTLEVVRESGFWIHPDLRKKGTKILPNLIKQLDQIRGKGKIFIVAENPESERIAMALGLKRVDSPVFVIED